MAKKTYKYRIYPTKGQQRILNGWLALCCEVYNAAVDKRKSAYRMAGMSLSYSQQCAELPGCKGVRPELIEINSQVLQEVVQRVNLAFEAFFRRLQEGQKTGYPRFKSRFRYASLTFKQYGNSFSFAEDGKLVLSKIGHVKIVLHRPWRGLPKTATISRAASGKWYASISCDEVEPHTLSPSDKQVGADVGLKTFAYLSDGTTIENPRFFRHEKKRKVVARIHERIRHRRENFVQQQTRTLVNQYGLIALEALIVRSMIKNPKLAKSIADASWSLFVRVLLDKAAEAGREVIRVNPAYTTQTCSACGHRQEMPLSVRVYECPQCGLIIDRDHNASKNILEQGLQAVGRHSRVIPEAPAL